MSALTNLMHGTLAGFAATFPMSAVMLVGRELLPPSEQYPLPPSEVVAEVAERAGTEEVEAGPDHTFATTVAHFAYGAGTGAVYTALPHPILSSPILSGALFGLTVWGGSHLGLLPAFGILRPATEHPARRNQCFNDCRARGLGFNPGGFSASINTPFFNKARTKIGVKPKGIPPIYQPHLLVSLALF